MMRLAAIVVAAAVCGMVGTSFGAPTDTSIEVYPDGLAYVTSQFEADPQEPSFQVGLLGTAVDNFMAVNKDGELLASQPGGDGSMALETFGSGLVMVSYDVHDIVSKDGRIWTFSLDVDYGYTLLMPADSVIVGMNVIPRDLDTVDDRVRLEMPGEPVQIRYVTNTGRGVEPAAPAPPENEESAAGDTALLVAIPLAAAAAGALVVIRVRTRRAAGERIADAPRAPPKGGAAGPLDPEAVFARAPELREEDKEIVRYICQSGGEMTESGLRKKFLRPKTTMWRAVQRLRREGVVDVEKRDSHNHITIKNLEDEG